MIISKFEQIMREHMDYFDNDTIDMIAEATDTDQSQILIALTSKLYEMIIAKVTKIDYSSVSSSRGDITKIENYSQLVETISIIKNIVAEYRCDTTPIATVEKAIENVQQRTAIFKKAFVIEAPLLIVLYNNICINIVMAVSYMIDTCIEYIKNPKSESFQMALDVVAYSKTMECVMFDTLKTFNEGCASGDIDAAINVSMNKSKVKREAAEMPVEEGYKFGNPDNVVLRLVDKCVKIIRKGKAQGISDNGIERQITNTIEKRLNSTDTGALYAYSFTYGAASGGLSKSEAILRTIQRATLSNIQEMERDYNAVHTKKRTQTQTYTDAEIKLIQKAAKDVRKQKLTVNRETFEMDPEAMADLKEFMEDCKEDMACAVAYSNPFQTDEDIDNPRVILHDGDITDHASIEEAFDGIASIVGRGLIALCKLVVPLIRHIVYLYFFSRQKVSDYFESQAIAIEMNAYQLQYNTDMEPERRQEIYNKQMRIAENLRKKAQRTSIDYKRSQKEAEREAFKEQKKFTAADMGINPNANDDLDAVNASILF